MGYETFVLTADYTESTEAANNKGAEQTALITLDPIYMSFWVRADLRLYCLHVEKTKTAFLTKNR